MEDKRLGFCFIFIVIAYVTPCTSSALYIDEFDSWMLYIAYVEKPKSFVHNVFVITSFH